MSTKTQDAQEAQPAQDAQAATDAMEMGTKPVAEHQWLQNLVGQWRIESEMTMEPGQPKQKGEGTESVKSVGGLWAFVEGKTTMPGGMAMTYYSTLGYDVSFKEYRSCWFASMSSHLWQYKCELSDDGKTLTMHCVGPSMSKNSKNGETANYRDVITLIDADHRTLTSFGQDENGQWHEFMMAHYTRV